MAAEPRDRRKLPPPGGRSMPVGPNTNGEQMDSANRGASGKSKKPEAGKGRRPPPVLDLTATEVTSEKPAENAAATPEQPASAPAAAAAATPPEPAVAAADAIPPEYPGAPAPEFAAEPEPAAAAPQAETTSTSVPGAGANTETSPSEPEPALAARERDPIQRDGGPASPPPPPERRRARRWPAVLGSVVGGGLAGAAATAAILYGLGLLPARPDRAAPEAMRLSALESQMRSITSAPPGASPARLDALEAGAAAGTQALDALRALEARLAKAEASLAQPAPAAAPAQPAAADPAVQALTESVSELRRRIDENAAAAQAARDAAQRSSGASETTAANLGGEVESLGRRVAALEASAKAIESGVQALRTETQGALQSLRADVAAAVQASRAPDPDRVARLAAATTALRLAVERGEPFGPELAAVKPFVDDPKRLTPLEPFAATGVPQAGTLARELVGLLDDQRRRTAAAAAGSETIGVLGRLQQSASKLVSIRPAEAPAAAPGTPLAALNAAAARGDLDGALAEAEKLPQAARAPLAPWIDKAKARAAAVAAARQLARDSLAALAANAAPRQ
jgi:hypothetical protein